MTARDCASYLGRVVVAAIAGLRWRLAARREAARAAQERNRGIPTIHEACEVARREWIQAVAYFDEVVEQDLVDYAAYSLRAAERKYVYLLKLARQQAGSPTNTGARHHIYK